MLTANRPAMAKQAVENFRAQTYQNKRLLVYDTSAEEIEWPEDWYESDDLCLLESNCNSHHRTAKTIGYLRNRAGLASGENDILIHFDDDDFSHTNRITEQVALLQSSGADCVGYNEMLFWREKRWCDCSTGKYGAHTRGCASGPGEAWLYRNPDPRYVLGTSLCYWRKTWERKPFEATSQGEDMRFIAGLKCAAVPAFGIGEEKHRHTPRMIARIHPGNTSTAYKPEAMQREARKRNGMWKRVPEWDSYCAGVMV